MTVDFTKDGGLVPAVIQDHSSLAVLMVGYMNADALAATKESGYVTFYSRSKNRLWKKGESSQNTLRVIEIFEDCDHDALLIHAVPAGPTCHTGETSCFGKNSLPAATSASAIQFISELEQLIQTRKTELPAGSYTTELFQKGSQKIAQKVGEEAVELILEHAEGGTRFHEEAADLLYHLLVLLAVKDSSLAAVAAVLERRHGKK